MLSKNDQNEWKQTPKLGNTSVTEINFFEDKKHKVHILNCTYHLNVGKKVDENAENPRSLTLKDGDFCLINLTTQLPCRILFLRKKL